MSDPQAHPIQPSGIVTLPSPYPVDETITRMEAAIQAQGITLFARIDHSDEATRVGLTMPPAHVLIFGNPHGGTPLMVASPLLALELPLKVLIWQDPDNHVWVSYTDGAYLAERFGIAAEHAGPLASVVGLINRALAA